MNTTTAAKSIKSSRGGTYKLQQASKKTKLSIDEIPSQLNDIEISQLLNSKKFTNCCSQTNCLASLFICDIGGYDFNSCIEFLRECREITRSKDNIEKDDFL